jgi:hypothetical protein
MGEDPLDGHGCLRPLDWLHLNVKQVAGLCGCDGFAGQRPFVEAIGRDNAAAVPEGFAPRRLLQQSGRSGVYGREVFELVEAVGEKGDHTPPHHDELSLTGIAVRSDYRLEGGGRDVIVPGRRWGSIIDERGVEGLGYLLFVSLAVVTATHEIYFSTNQLISAGFL